MSSGRMTMPGTAALLPRAPAGGCGCVLCSVLFCGCCCSSNSMALAVVAGEVGYKWECRVACSAAWSGSPLQPVQPCPAPECTPPAAVMCFPCCAAAVPRRKYKIEYDDGDVEVIDLSQERVRFLQLQQPAAGSKRRREPEAAPAVAAGTTGAKAARGEQQQAGQGRDPGLPAAKRGRAGLRSTDQQAAAVAASTPAAPSRATSEAAEGSAAPLSSPMVLRLLGVGSVEAGWGRVQRMSKLELQVGVLMQMSPCMAKCATRVPPCTQVPTCISSPRRVSSCNAACRHSCTPVCSDPSSLSCAKHSVLPWPPQELHDQVFGHKATAGQSIRELREKLGAGEAGCWHITRFGSRPWHSMQPGGGPYAAGQHAYMSLVSKVGLANQVPPLKETGDALPGCSRGGAARGVLRMGGGPQQAQKGAVRNRRNKHA